MRAHDIATEYARKRTSFGKPLGEHEGVSFMLADNAMDIHTCRLAIWHCAWVLDQGQRARHGKLDGQGHLLGGDLARRRPLAADPRRPRHDRDTVVERIFRDVRAFRIYDGPSEVHRFALGRREVKGKKQA